MFQHLRGSYVFRFHRAAAHGYVEIVNVLLSHGADTNATDVQGKKDSAENEGVTLLCSK